MNTGMIFLQQLINGLSLGSIYALIALGYTMVYGIVKLINFAHGDIMMIGAYTAYFVLRAMGTNVSGMVVAFVVAMTVCALLSIVILIFGVMVAAIRMIADSSDISSNLVVFNLVTSSFTVLVKLIVFLLSFHCFFEKSTTLPGDLHYRFLKEFLEVTI